MGMRMGAASRGNCNCSWGTGTEDAWRWAMRVRVRRTTFFRSSSIRKRLTCKGSGFFLGGICWVMVKVRVKLRQIMKGSWKQVCMFLILKVKFWVVLKTHWNQQLTRSSVNTWKIRRAKSSNCIQHHVWNYDHFQRPTARGCTSSLSDGETGLKTPCQVLVVFQ